MPPLLARLIRLLATLLVFVGGMYLAIPNGFPHVWNRSVWLSVLPFIGMLLLFAVIWRSHASTLTAAIGKAIVTLLALIVLTVTVLSSIANHSSEEGYVAPITGLIIALLVLGGILKLWGKPKAAVKTSASMMQEHN